MNKRQLDEMVRDYAVWAAAVNANKAAQSMGESTWCVSEWILRKYGKSPDVLRVVIEDRLENYEELPE